MTNISTQGRHGHGTTADNEAIQRTKAAVFGALAKAGITQACVKFKEESGHGHIERAVAKTHGGCVSFPEITITVYLPRYDHGETIPCEMMLQDAIEHLCWDWLEWEVDDDSLGEFVFDAEKQKITLDFHKRTRQTEHVILEL
jgi:hypothetical protein